MEIKDIIKKFRNTHEAWWCHSSPLTIDEQRALIERVEELERNAKT